MDVNLVFRPVLKGKTTSPGFQILNYHQETLTAGGKARGDSSGEREIPQVKIPGFI